MTHTRRNGRLLTGERDVQRRVLHLWDKGCRLLGTGWPEVMNDGAFQALWMREFGSFIYGPSATAKGL